MALELNYVMYGSLQQPCLVILHGLLGSCRNWASIGKALMKDFCVLCVDLRNHGHSPHNDHSNYGCMAEDVVQFIKTKCPSKPVLIGHSLGGKVAMAVACTYPEIIEKLIVVDIAPKTYDIIHSRREFEGLNAINLNEYTTRQAVEHKLSRWVTDMAMRQFLMTNLVYDEVNKAFKWQMNLPVLTKHLPGFSLSSIEPTAQYTQPTLFIRGLRSCFVEDTDEILIYKHFPKNSLMRLDCGHNPHVELREVFIYTLKNFLS